MEIKTKAILLTAESKPYDFDGNKGVSHNIRVSVDGEIYVCKSTAAQVESLKKYERKEGTAVIRVNSRREKMSLELVSFA